MEIKSTRINQVMGALNLAEFHLNLMRTHTISEDSATQLKDSLIANGGFAGSNALEDYIVDYALKAIFEDHVVSRGTDLKEQFLESIANISKVIKNIESDSLYKLYDFKVNIEDKYEELDIEVIISAMEGFAYDLDINSFKRDYCVKLMRNYLFNPRENLEKISNLSAEIKTIIE
jgi:hypothetical protein